MKSLDMQYPVIDDAINTGMGQFHAVTKGVMMAVAAGLAGLAIDYVFENYINPDEDFDDETYYVD